MGIATEDTLKKHIKEKTFSPVYLITGDDDYSKKYYMKKLAESVIGTGLEDFNLHYIEGRNTNITEISVMAEALPMMSEYTCIVVTDFNLAKLGADDYKKFEEMLEQPNPSCVLIFYFSSLEADGKKAGWSKVFKTVSKTGCVIGFKKKDLRQLEKIIAGGVKKRGCTMPQYVAQYFVSRVGDDLNMLLNETDKLCAMKGSGEITREDIDAVCVKTLESSVYDLANSLLRHNASRAYEILDELFAQRVEPLAVLNTLNSNYIDIYRVKLAQEKGLAPDAVANFYDYGRLAWKLKNASYTAKNLDKAKIRKSLDALYEADSMIKSSANDSKIIIEQTLMKLMLIADSK